MCKTRATPTPRSKQEWNLDRYELRVRQEPSFDSGEVPQWAESSCPVLAYYHYVTPIIYSQSYTLRAGQPLEFAGKLFNRNEHRLASNIEVKFGSKTQGIEMQCAVASNDDDVSLNIADLATIHRRNAYCHHYRWILYGVTLRQCAEKCVADKNCEYFTHATGSHAASGRTCRGCRTLDGDRMNEAASFGTHGEYDMYASRAVQSHPHGGSTRFRLALRTYDAPPWGYV